MSTDPVPGTELSDTDDLYLEEVEGAAARAWVEARRGELAAELESDPAFEPMRRDAAARLETPDRLALPQLHGPRVYNFWQDAEHVRGVWRRTSWEGFRAPVPPWETILDVDRLAEEEREPWVFHYARLDRPESDRALVFLSRGGRDAAVLREFSFSARAFVSGGFTLPEGKSVAAWSGVDKLAVATPLGADSVTTSGYPRQIRLWRRGQPVASAPVLMECGRDEVLAWPVPLDGVPGCRVLCLRWRSFFRRECAVLREDGVLLPVEVPDSAIVLCGLRGRLLFLLRDDWAPARGALAGRVLAGGSVIAVRITADGGIPERELVFAPGPGESVQHAGSDPDTLYLFMLRNVGGVVRALHPSPPLPNHSGWPSRELDLPPAGRIDLVSANAHAPGAVLVHTGFLTPNTLYFTRGEGPALESLRAEAPRFDATGLEVRQHWATSRDGTRVPYFVVGPASRLSGPPAPAILTGYGGFRASCLPEYDPVRGRLWLEAGGLWVLANLRGGGEFGPQWHRAALRENRPRAYEDFEAVAEDLIRRRLTAPNRLGIYGGSNGGLLVGSAMVRRPELYRAVYCRNPLLDMLRFALLSAGRSWIEEYGDPELPADRADLRTRSPYHQVRPGTAYPKVFFATSAIDDRVHPGHARRMAERLRRLGQPVLYYENVEGGHAGTANLRERAWLSALGFLFFRRELGLGARDRRSAG